MNEPTPTDTPAPIIRHISIHICQQCLDGKGSECHTPGCALFLHRVDLPFLRSLYEILPDAPAPSLTGEEVSDKCHNAARNEINDANNGAHAHTWGKHVLALLSTARAQDKAIVDHLAKYWDSQGAGQTIMGRFIPNTTGSFRDSLRSAIDASKPQDEMNSRLPIFKALRALGGELNEQGLFVFGSVDDANAALALIESEFPLEHFQIVLVRAIKVL